MNIGFWIFTGLLVVVLFLYILAQVKNIVPLEKTTRSLFVPVNAGLIISALVLFLPDSWHIILISSFAFIFALAFMLFTLNDKNKFLKGLEELCYILIQAVWLFLVVSVYRIYRVPQMLFIITGIVYFAGFIVMCFFIKKQSLIKYGWAFLLYAVNSFLGITTFICMIYEKRLFGIIMFISSLSFMFGTVLIIFQRTRPFAISEKLEKILITTAVVASSALMGTGAILMQL